MKKILSIGLIAAFLILLGSIDASAQRRKSKDPQPTEQKEPTEEDSKPSATSKKTPKKKTDDYFDEKGGFKHRLWYGGNFILNYSGSNGQSAFTIGATPMVGYKIRGGLSAGPRIGFNYTNYKDAYQIPSVLKLTEFSAGPFVRYKFLKTFFVQGEYEFLRSYQEDASGNILLDRTTNKPVRAGRTNYYGGVGYNNSMGAFGYEFSFMWNFGLPAGSYKQPYDIRFGFNYNF